MDEKNLRNDVHGPYGFICEQLLPCVIGAVVWKKNVFVDGLCQFTQVTDETFCLFCIKNSYDTWVADWKRKEAKKKGIHWTTEQIQKMPKPVYTDGVAKKAKRFNGWNSTGRKRWNELCSAIARLRREKGEDFDGEFLALMRSRKKDDKDAAEGGGANDAEDEEDGDGSSKDEQPLYNDF